MPPGKFNSAFHLLFQRRVFFISQFKLSKKEDDRLNHPLLQLII